MVQFHCPIPKLTLFVESFASKKSPPCHRLESPTVKTDVEKCVSSVHLCLQVYEVVARRPAVELKERLKRYMGIDC